MKRLFALILSASLFFGVAACSYRNDNTATSEATISDVETSTVYDDGYNQGYSDGYAAALADCAAEQDAMLQSSYDEGFDAGVDACEAGHEAIREQSYSDGYNDAILAHLPQPSDEEYSTESTDATIREPDQSYTSSESTGTASTSSGSQDSASSDNHTPSGSLGRNVYVTNTGAKYHSYGCRYLSQSCIPIGIDSAIAQGYTPCSVCTP